MDPKTAFWVKTIGTGVAAVLASVAATATIPGAPIPVWVAVLCGNFASNIALALHVSPPGTQAKIEAAARTGSIRPPPLPKV